LRGVAYSGEKGRLEAGAIPILRFMTTPPHPGTSITVKKRRTAGALVERYMLGGCKGARVYEVDPKK